VNVVLCLRATRATPELLDRADAQALAHGARLRAAGHTLIALYAATPADAPGVAARLAPLVDRAVRVASDELAAADFHTVGQMLATAIRRLAADLVLAPLQGDDDAPSAVPAALARHLGARCLAFVEEVAALDAAGVEVVTRGGGRKRRLQVALPAVLATVDRAGAPAPDPAPAAETPAVETLSLTDPEATLVRRRTELLGRPEPASRGTETVRSASELMAALTRR
jgi:electron transfer flavoprotein beta subunit